jgi:hypothetical protein
MKFNHCNENIKKTCFPILKRIGGIRSITTIVYFEEVSDHYKGEITFRNYKGVPLRVTPIQFNRIEINFSAN